MNWLQYLLCFGAGLFLANGVPHFVKGICGDKFPTPFAKPPGKGLSSSIVNVVWGLLNLVIGAILFRAGKVYAGEFWQLGLCVLGVLAMSVMLSVNFSKKHAS